MIKLLSRRERIILYATVSIIIFAIAFNFLIAPVLTKNDNLNKEINLTREKLKKYLWLLSQKDNIQAKYNQFLSTSNLAGQETCPDKLVGTLAELENLAKNADIKITDIRPQGGSKNLTAYRENLVDLRTEGAMAGYLKFIYNIENSFSLLRIKKFQLTSKPNMQSLEGTFSISQISPFGY